MLNYLWFVLYHKITYCKEHHTYIKFPVKWNKTAPEFCKVLKFAFGEAVTQTFHCFSKLISGVMQFNDAESSGHPSVRKMGENVG